MSNTFEGQLSGRETTKQTTAGDKTYYERIFQVKRQVNGHDEEATFTCKGFEKCEMIGKLSKGDNVRVHYQFRTNRYNDKRTGEPKFFAFVEAWRVESVGAQTSAPAPTTATNVAPPPPPPAGRVHDSHAPLYSMPQAAPPAQVEEDDLPF